MSGTNVRNAVAYGLSEALPIVFTPPIISNRDPLTKDRAPLGTLWVNKVSNDAFILTSVVANVSSWVGVGGGSGTFTNVTASGFVHAGTNMQAGTTITAGTGITATTGNIVASAGNITASGSLTCSTGLLVNAGGASITAGDLNVVAGDIIAVDGDIEADAGSLAAVSVYSTGDLGGVASTTGITNVTNTSLSTGTLSIKATTANPGNNAGFIKIYVGTGVAYIPYFTNIAP